MDTNLIERRNAEYQPLIESFKERIKGLELEGITRPQFRSWHSNRRTQSR